jgi:hypothetical protein
LSPSSSHCPRTGAEVALAILSLMYGPDPEMAICDCIGRFGRGGGPFGHLRPLLAIEVSLV